MSVGRKIPKKAEQCLPDENQREAVRHGLAVDLHLEGRDVEEGDIHEENAKDGSRQQERPAIPEVA